jgi:predicted N-formylglutamate amidohydrolase
MKWVVLITCEHGGNQIPEAYREAFAVEDEWLASHRGYDIGALELYRLLAEGLADEQDYSETSRLLVELNRSEHHSNLFSKATKSLPKTIRENILQEHYRPYRERVEANIRKHITKGRKVLHISVHSFTPVLNGEERNTDIGLLYDPKSKAERDLSLLWKDFFKNCIFKVSVRFNYPYKGTADGFTTYLRKQFTADSYAGIELEVNQKFPLGDPVKWEKMKVCIKDSLAEAISHFNQNSS